MRWIKVTNVTALKGPRLDLTFSDGTQGIGEQAHIERGAVVWNDELHLASEFLYARAHGLEPPRTGEDVAANQLVVTMRQLRAIAGKTQVEVAEAMGVAQAEVSRLEGRKDSKLSTIERYVEALGGEVEVVARFGDRSLRLHSV